MSFLSKLKYRAHLLYQTSLFGRIACFLTRARCCDQQKAVSIVCFHTTVSWWDGYLPPGTAGSEEAVVEMARALSSLGWKVTVYNNCKRRKLIGRILYKPSWTFNPQSRHDVVVVWRGTMILQSSINASAVYLWLHDVPAPNDLSPLRIRNADKLIVLSDFHRELVWIYSDNRILVSRNGCSHLPSQLRARRSSKRCIYISAPDRGLECLLRMWPQIRNVVPDAELAVFYGWDIWESSNRHNYWAQCWRRKIERMICQPGVVSRYERLREDELWVELLSSRLWLYPTEFAETSCISAMRAQMAGALPVTTSAGALPETVRWGNVLDLPDIYSSNAAQRRYVKAVVDLLQEQYDEQVVEEAMCASVERFSWQNTAEEWSVDFQRMRMR